MPCHCVTLHSLLHHCIKPSLMKVKLSIPDKRMLLLIDLLKDRGTIRFRQEFCDATCVLKQTIVNIRKGTQSFTVAQITAACKAYNVNSNWLLGLSEETFVQKGKLRFIGDTNTINKKSVPDRKKQKKSS